MVADSGLFSDEQFETALPAGVEQNYWFRARHQLLVGALRPHVQPGELVLDVGCGPGLTVRYLTAAGLDCYGVEPASRQHAEGVEGRVFAGTPVSETPIEVADKVGCLMYLDVIEHVQDPVALLRQGLERCPNARLVLLTVPGRQEIWTNYDDYYGHYRRYSRTDLRRDAVQAGLEPLHVGYMFHSLYVAVGARKVLGKERSLEGDSPRFPLVHQLVAEALKLETKWLPSSLPGTSVLGLFRRR